MIRPSGSWRIAGFTVETVSALVMIGLVLVMMGGTLAGTDRLGFRDVSHFYTPLYDYVAGRQSQTWLPLWNPMDATGMPLAGETTTAVFYPVRMLIYGLIDSPEMAMAWYVAVHWCLAALTGMIGYRWMMRSGRWGPPLAGLVYAFSGSVFYLHTNPPFLVSAAWLPLALGGLLNRTTEHPSMHRRTGVAAIAMAMMVLGGDPQTALHVVLIAGLIGLIAISRGRWGWRNSNRPSGGRPIIRIAIASLLAGGMSLPQIAASWSWASQSDRAVTSDTRSAFLPPIVGSRKHESMQYSVPPWHVTELLTPNASGSLLPIYRRITSLWPGDGRVWTPTLYMGMVVAIALLDRLCRIRRRGIGLPLAIASLSLVCCFGHFGLAWCVQAITGTMANVDSGVGGPYWILYHALPGYDSFRYPAKWLPLFAWGMALLTGQWIDRQRWRRAMPILVAGSIAAMIAWVLVSWTRANLDHVVGPVDARPVDAFWGPLDVDGGLVQIQRSIIHSIIVIAALGALIAWARRRTGTTGLLFRTSARTGVALGCLLITTVDLGVADFGWITRVSVADEREIMERIQTPERISVQGRWMRTIQDGGWPRSWAKTSSAKRGLEVEASQRAARFGRWHLSTPGSDAGNTGRASAMLNNMVSIRSSAMADYWRWTRQQTAGKSDSEQQSFWQAQRSLLAIEAVTHASGATTRLPLGKHTAEVIDVQFVSVQTSATSTANAITHRISEPGSYIRPVYQDGHWTAEYRANPDLAWQPVAVHIAGTSPPERLMQRIELPARTWQIRFRYRPWWMPWTLAIAGATWVLIAIGTASSVYRWRSLRLKPN